MYDYYVTCNCKFLVFRVFTNSVHNECAKITHSYNEHIEHYFI